MSCGRKIFELGSDTHDLNFESPALGVVEVERMVTYVAVTLHSQG